MNTDQETKLKAFAASSNWSMLLSHPLDEQNWEKFMAAAKASPDDIADGEVYGVIKGTTTNPCPDDIAGKMEYMCRRGKQGRIKRFVAGVKEAMKGLFSLACLMMPLMSAADIKVSDVEVFSGYPWKEVVVGYTIMGKTNVPTYVTLTATDLIARKNYMAVTLSGAEATEGRHIMKWNPADDDVSLKSSKVTFTVGLSDEEYLVVDLSSGALAKNYPTRLIGIASGVSLPDLFKTKRLLLRRIDAGSFMMQGIKETTLTKPFYLGCCAVTQRQWELIMGANPCSDMPDVKGETCPVYYVSYDMIRGCSLGAGWPGADMVDPDSFIGKLQERTGLNFDLPSEAQWEYACRAGTTTACYWGDETDENSAYCYIEQGSPVGLKMSNAWNLYDMCGDKWEWCLDWYGDLSYGVDPLGGVGYAGACRVLRGKWTSSNRSWGNPPGTGKNIGFRLARVLQH